VNSPPFELEFFPSDSPVLGLSVSLGKRSTYRLPKDTVT